MTPQHSRALRRALRVALTRRWLKRLKAKRRRWQQDPQKLVLEAKRRVDTHRDIRNHCRKSCSYCNPYYRYLKARRDDAKLHAEELKLLSLNLHDLLRPAAE